jgi:copper(I)-binding protein
VSAKRLVRALAGVIAGVGVVVAVSACSAGQITQTSSQVAAVPGANADAGSVALRDLVVAYNGPQGYAQGASAPLVVRIFNNGQTAVQLVGATAEGAASGVTLTGGTQAQTESQNTSPSPTATGTASPTATATPSPAQNGEQKFSVEIPPVSYVLLVPGSGQYLQLTGLTNAIIPGQSVPVTFSFSDGSSVKVDVPLVPPNTVVPRATPVVTQPAGE